MDKFLKGELSRLRDQYVTATPRQRRNVIEQRLNNPHAYPNRLVTHIASVEAFARTLVMNSHAKTKNELRAIYPQYRFKKVENMIREYLRINELGKAPDVFGVENWRIFRIAIEYRNLLIHECTYLGSVKFNSMVKAAQVVLNKLTKLARIKVTR
jgi:hypothetical protein